MTARLQHPNVTSVLDSGEIETGNNANNDRGNPGKGDKR